MGSADKNNKLSEDSFPTVFCSSSLDLTEWLKQEVQKKGQPSQTTKRRRKIVAKNDQAQENSSNLNKNAKV